MSRRKVGKRRKGKNANKRSRSTPAQTTQLPDALYETLQLQDGVARETGAVDGGDERDYARFKPRQTKDRKQLRKEKRMAKRKRKQHHHKMVHARHHPSIAATAVASQQTAKKKKKVHVPEESSPIDVDVRESSEYSSSVASEESSDASASGEIELSSSYKPPHREPRGRAQSSAETAQIATLQRQIRGTMNRLALQSLFPSAEAISQLTSDFPRDAVFDLVVSFIMNHLRKIPSDRVIAVYAGLLSALFHQHEMGQLLPSMILEQCAVTFVQGQTESRVQVQAAILKFIGYMYHFHMMGSPLCASILQRLLDKFGPAEIELFLPFLKQVGMKLRNDDATSLYSIVKMLQQKSREVSTNDVRTQFALDSIMEIKDNRFRMTDASLDAVSQSLKKGLSKKMGIPLREVKFDDLLNVETNARWWLRGGLRAESSAMNKSKLVPTHSKRLEANETTKKMVQLSKQQQMNTDLKKKIFAILMTAEGYDAAFYKIAKLNLKGKVDRDVVHVLTKCCANEKDYNPYYGYVAALLCRSSKSYKRTFRFSFWDSYRDIEKLSMTQVTNLARLLCHLLCESCVTFATLKLVDWVADLSPKQSCFINTIFSTMVADTSACTQDALSEIFSRLRQAETEEMSLLRDGLLLFLKFSLVFSRTQVQDQKLAKMRLSLIKAILIQ